MMSQHVDIRCEKSNARPVGRPNGAHPARIAGRCRAGISVHDLGAVFGTQRRDDFAGAQRRPRMKARTKEVARTIVRSG